MIRENRTELVKRLLGCLAGGVVLALMWGQQEGSNQDYGFAFRESVLNIRIVWFLLIGVIAFLLITFWPAIRPYVLRPGVRPLAAGFLLVAAAQALLHWDDQVGSAKFSDVAGAVADTPTISFLASAYFGWLAWIQWLVLLVLAAVVVATRLRWLSWVTAVLAVVAGVIVWEAHQLVVDLAHPDHSLGAGVATLGYLAVAGGALTVGRSEQQAANSREFLDRVATWRVGLPVTAVGLVIGLLAFTTATWFAPTSLDATFSDTARVFRSTALAGIAQAYLQWLGWVLFAAAVVVAAAGAYLRAQLLGWIATALGLLGVLLTLLTIYDFSKLAAGQNFDSATGPWQNLGSGGWLAAAAFFLLAAGGYEAARAARRSRRTAERELPDPSTGRITVRGGALQSLVFVVIAVALFYPPTATSFWQQVLVSEIGIYVLLAVGLNVVVGWAGLLDLGYIAFYAIGSYTTAYLSGSLPVKPPSWLHLSPLWAIPFAILACLAAGVILGAPTLRLRGDYLAIVTLGFGEIIRIVAVNANGLTNGPRGVSPSVPHPVLNLGFIRFEWGLNNLQYWYLLLFFVVVVVLLFRRLEHSRTGRAWAAIREDEVAAAATGINTTRTKLLAFAIGASTSGLAGVLFASQVGFFNPDNFILANSILVVAYVVFGGMGSLPGVMVGAASLVWLQEFLRDQVPPPDRQMWVGALLLLMMIFRPGGLIPARRRAAELRGLSTAPDEEPETVPADEGLGVGGR
ncbi:MAG TPA: branched-chain amino acid ABC transporter permease [Blastococcus sp.]|nr:branched-chain amino acid ABC transporter permease [Blastococcus sp.]